MPAWIWLVLGIFLIILELLTPSGFFLFILGLSGVTVGAFVAGGVFSGWMVEVSVFCVVAVVFWIAMGKRLAGFFLQARPLEHQGQIVGSVVKISNDIPVSGTGTGTLWGTQWQLENVDKTVLAAGSEAVVVASQGIKLQVKKK